MESLEGYTIERVKEMPREELIVLWNKINEEKQEMDLRATIVNMIDIMDANKSMVEN